MHLTLNSLKIDPAAEAERIVAGIRRAVRRELHRSGAVVGVSGGIDSALVLALCVRALRAERVTALLLPEVESSPDSLRLGRLVCAAYGVEPVVEDITPALQGFGCYRRRDEAVRRVFPEYDPAQGYKVKIGLPQTLLDEEILNVFSLTVVDPQGGEQSKRLPPAELLQIVAASNFKQRTRMAMLYYHAELHNYAVIGTGNKNEHDQGFFVKYGDGGADIQPIVHLFKTQVYQLARHLAVPEEILERAPTSDTYSAPCTQQEFFFRLPFETMDLLWYAQERGLAPSEAARAIGLTTAQVQRAYNDFTRKQRTTEYLRKLPLSITDWSG
jgi:NAD+ synthase